MNNKWHQNGNTYSLREVSTQVDLLPNAVYVVRFAPMMGFYLEQISDAFVLPDKIYGVGQDFVKRVMRTWEYTNSNLGVLLNGIRGTGKTVTCEMISNQIGLPTIIVDTNYDGLAGFIAEIQQDVVLFFDEFEKVFPRDYGHPSKLLMLMDGVMKGSHRKLFLLTTNEISIEPNMIQRPGRIRYLKTFGNLDLPSIMEIVKDKLHDQSRLQAVVQFIAELELITVDIVTAIVNEVNIHSENPDVFKHIFNVKKIAENYAVYELFRNEHGIKTSEKLINEHVKINPVKIVKDEVEGNYFYVNRDDIGIIEEVIDFNTISVQPDYPDDWEEGQPKPPLRFFRVEERSSYNQVFGRGTKVIDFAYLD